MSMIETGIVGHRVGGDLASGGNGGTFRRRRPDPSPVETEGVSWVCVRTRPGREFAVSDDFQAIGFRVFCPHGVKVYLRARVHGSDVRKRAECDYPVFGSYLFVEAATADWLARYPHRHVFGVLTNAGGSRSVPSRFVHGASHAWARGAWDGRRKPEDRFKFGEAVRITSGPFEGWSATVEAMPSELQAIVRVQMFGAERKIKVDAETIEGV